jgi:hypothetical protein
MKIKLLIFSFVALIIASFSVGCGEDAVDGCVDLNGRRDTGAHVVWLGAINPGLTPINDTLDATASGDELRIASKALGRILTASVDPADCNKILFDSVIFATDDTLRIESSTLPVPGGIVKIWNIRGGGSGTVTETGVTTSIKIAKGNTNITAPVNLSNLAGLNLELKGKFLKLN